VAPALYRDAADGRALPVRLVRGNDIFVIRLLCFKIWARRTEVRETIGYRSTQNGLADQDRCAGLALVEVVGEK